MAGVIGSVQPGNFLMQNIITGGGIPAYNFATASGNGWMADTLAGHLSAGAVLTVIPHIRIDYKVDGINLSALIIATVCAPVSDGTYTSAKCLKT
jgi:hypothetical protein